MNIYDLKTLDGLTKVPDDPQDYAAWIEQSDVIPFLESEINDEYIILFGSHEFTYMTSLLIPDTPINIEELETLKAWQTLSHSSWGIWSGSGSKVWITPALSDERSPLLQKGEQIFYNRSFEGDNEFRSYFELSQKMSHLLDIHYMDSRKAWCKLDHLGDIVETVKIIQLNDHSRMNRFLVIRKDALTEYMGLTNTQLLRMFDFTRFRPGSLNNWQGHKLTHIPKHPSIFGKLGIMSGHASYTRGIQLASFGFNEEEIEEKHGFGSYRKKQKYVSFIAYDYKNKQVVECSCNPKEMDSYFEDRGKPFETTPVFFKPEVLLKYKSDNEKYKLKNGYIICRGTWSLETYDINEAGQVHTYLVYLGNLPYEEQLHWKQFNEAPKTGISKRAFTTDFKGEWHSEYDPLDSLKHKLETLGRKKTEWWQFRGSNTFDKIHYPVSNSQKEWSDEILYLDQLLIEGLNEKWLRKKAELLGQTPKPQFRSLKLLELCLIGLGFNTDHASEILSPFFILNTLRNKVKGHIEGQEAKELIKGLKREHGSFSQHYKALVTRLDESLAKVIEALS